MKPGSPGWRPGPKNKSTKGATANEKTAISKKKNSGVEILRFPGDLGKHYIQLDFYEYQYSSVSKGEKPQGLVASIALPMPQNIVDSSRLEVGGSQLGVLGALGADMASGGFSASGFGDFAKRGFAAGQSMGSALGSMDFANISAAFGNSIGAGIDTGLYLMRAGLGKVSPQIQQGLGSAVGTAMNPQTTLVFEGVDLKIHNFEWLLSPANRKEQKELDKIIQLIQYYIHPDFKEVSATGAIADSLSRGLLSYPALIDVKLVGVSGNLKTIFKPGKYLMVNQFNIDYTPQGVVLNKGGTASVIRCSMNTTESQIHTRQDYRYGEYEGLAPVADAKQITLGEDTVTDIEDAAAENSAKVSGQGEGGVDKQPNEAGGGE
jgi:hypothetical protein